MAPAGQRVKTGSKQANDQDNCCRDTCFEKNKTK